MDTASWLCQEKRSSCNAACSSALASGPSAQNFVRSRGLIWALANSPARFRRVRWIARALSTRCLMTEEGSPSDGWVRACSGTAGTSMCRSMRSSSGPESFPRYAATLVEEQRQRRDGSVRYPQGHPFSTEYRIFTRRSPRLHD